MKIYEFLQFLDENGKDPNIDSIVLSIGRDADENVHVANCIGNQTYEMELSVDTVTGDVVIHGIDAIFDSVLLRALDAEEEIEDLKKEIEKLENRLDATKEALDG